MSMYDAWQESKKNATNGLTGSAFIRRHCGTARCGKKNRPPQARIRICGAFRRTRSEVDKLLEYCHRQGLTTRKFEPEEMFHPSTLET